MLDAQEDTRSGQVAESSDLVTRRRFLGYMSGLLSGVIAVALGLPLVRFFIGDVFKPREQRWVKLGEAAEVTPGQPRLFRAGHIDRDGWRQLTRREAVYAVTHDREEFTVFSYACTHLGCPVHWDDDAKLFLCPCHNGGFSIDGEVVKGPAPRPLDRLDHKIENGVLYVRVAGV